jgi:hypothetical protein
MTEINDLIHKIAADEKQLYSTQFIVESYNSFEIKAIIGQWNGQPVMVNAIVVPFLKPI